MSLDQCRQCDLWLTTDGDAQYVPGTSFYDSICLCEECFANLQEATRLNEFVQVSL
jgi:hypothetical protein